MERRLRRLCLVELVLALLVLAAGLAGLVAYSTTPYLLALGWILLQQKGLRWRDLGFARPRSWPRACLLGVFGGLAYALASLFVIEPLVERFVGELPDLSRFTEVEGNWKNLVLALLLTWTLAAFGEELVYRGTLWRSAAYLGGGSTASWVASLLFVSALFGLGHLYQGLAGVITTGLLGIFFGALYLATERNLWAPILAHGTINSFAFVLIYFGSYPGLEG